MTNELDDQFHELTENLSALLINYIRLHPEEFMANAAGTDKSRQSNPAAR